MGDKSDVGRIGDFGIDGLWNETNALSEYDDALVVKDSDIKISKTRYSSFVGTGLEETLKSKGVDTIVVTGFMTQFCVTTTTRHGHDLDFKVIAPKDANDGPDLPEVPIAVTKQALNAHGVLQWLTQRRPRNCSNACSKLRTATL